MDHSTIVITGASSGIGKEACEHFLGLDFKVIRMSRRSAGILDESFLDLECDITDDDSANFTTLVKEIADIPAISVNPGLENSQYSGLKAFSEGFAKEGVGAGGSIISSMIKTGNDSTKFLEIAEKEYHRLFTSQ